MKKIEPLRDNGSPDLPPDDLPTTPTPKKP